MKVYWFILTHLTELKKIIFLENRKARKERKPQMKVAG
jgi:hypothetical protein